MHVFVTSPALATIISHQVRRESRGRTTEGTQPPSRAERRAARRAARDVEEDLRPHRLARRFRPAH